MQRMISKIEQAISEKRSIKIYRDNIDPDSIYGIPLLVSEELLLIQVLYDFQFDGYTIVRLSDITSIMSEENQHFIDFILKEEGLSNQITPSPLSNIDCWNGVFQQLLSQKKNVIVECEKEDDEEDFFIGRIQQVAEDLLTLIYFDPLGRCEEEPHEIQFDDITCVSFDTRYINVFSKYIK